MGVEIPRGRFQGKTKISKGGGSGGVVFSPQMYLGLHEAEFAFPCLFDAEHLMSTGVTCWPLEKCCWGWRRWSPARSMVACLPRWGAATCFGTMTPTLMDSCSLTSSSKSWSVLAVILPSSGYCLVTVCALLGSSFIVGCLTLNIAKVLEKLFSICCLVMLPNIDILPIYSDLWFSQFFFFDIYFLFCVEYIAQILFENISVSCRSVRFWWFQTLHFKTMRHHCSYSYY